MVDSPPPNLGNLVVLVDYYLVKKDQIIRAWVNPFWAMPENNNLVFINVFPYTFTINLASYLSKENVETCDFWDIWSEWWGPDPTKEADLLKVYFF